MLFTAPLSLRARKAIGISLVDLGDVYAAGDTEHALDRLDVLRDLHEKNTHLLPSLKALKKDPAAARILANAGCDKSIGKAKISIK